jgi:hypothetical protein
MHYLVLIYFVIQPLHVSGVFSAYYKEVFTVYVQKIQVTGRCSHLNE